MNGSRYTKENWSNLESVLEELAISRRKRRDVDERYAMMSEYMNMKDDEESDDDNENLMDQKMEFLDSNVDFSKIFENPKMGTIFNNIADDNIFEKKKDELTQRDYLAIMMMMNENEKNYEMNKQYPHIVHYGRLNRKENTKRELNEVVKGLDGPRKKFSRAQDFMLKKLVNILPESAIEQLDKRLPEIVMNSKSQNDILGGKRALINFDDVLPDSMIANDVVNEYLETVPIALLNRLEANDRQKEVKI